MKQIYILIFLFLFQYPCFLKSAIKNDDIIKKKIDTFLENDVDHLPLSEIEKINIDDKLVAKGKQILSVYNSTNANILDRKLISKALKDIKKYSEYMLFWNWMSYLSLIGRKKNIKELYSIKSIIDKKYYNIFQKSLHKNLKRIYFKVFLRYLNVKLKKKHKIDDSYFELISENIGSILHKKLKGSFKVTLRRLKKYKDPYRDLSTSILNEYQKKNKLVPTHIQKMIFLSDNQLKKVKEQRNYSHRQKSRKRELNRKLKKLEKMGMRSHDKKIPLAREKFREFGNKVFKSKITDDEWKINKLLFVSKILLKFKEYQMAQELIEKTLTIKNKNISLDKRIFHLMWVAILQNNFRESINIIEKYEIRNKIEKHSNKLLFWCAYSYFNEKKIKEVIPFIKYILHQRSLSYYAILSSKLLKKIIPEKENFYRQILNKEYRFELSFNDLHSSIKNSIKRLHVWNKLYSGLFIDLESKFLKNNPNVFVHKKYSKKDKVIAKGLILSSLNNYLQTFYLINKNLNNRSIKLDRMILKILFPKNYLKQIISYEKKIDPNIILSLIRQESAFNPRARSSAGAVGLMQLLPRTARSITKNATTKRLKNPQLNLKVGIRYLKQLLRKFNGNLFYTFAAYNAGESVLGRWKRNIFTQNPIYYNVEVIPYTETRNYVQLLIRNIFFYKLSHDYDEEDNHSLEKIYDISLTKLTS